jgi:hypothetical protein
VSVENAVKKWYIKLNRVKKFLKGWGINLKGQSKKYKLLLQKELAKLEEQEEERILSANLLDRKTFIQSELMRLPEGEELYWHKRSNENWLLHGDNNTTYFHRKANGKKGKILFLTWKRMERRLIKWKILSSWQLNIIRICLDPLMIQPFP